MLISSIIIYIPFLIYIQALDAQISTEEHLSEQEDFREENLKLKLLNEKMKFDMDRMN